MTAFERRQRILELLRARPGTRVTEIAGLLAVSQGTIRNDLNVLARAGQLERVRGGAVVLDDLQCRSPAFATRARINQAAKQRIARRAAEMVTDGDAILLDASTTVYYMAYHLQNRRNLTVVTNGLEVARQLAQNPTHTVILLGGVLSTDGTSVTGPWSEPLLKDLHVKTGFVSCSGFTPAVGLTEVDIHEAQLKSKMIACAASLVALVDASKFGRVDVTPFARAGQISHLFTDGNISPHWIEQLQQAGIALTICGDAM